MQGFAGASFRTGACSRQKANREPCVCTWSDLAVLERLAMLCAWTKFVVTAAVLLLYSIAYVCDAGCSRPSPCTTVILEGITPEGEDLVTSLDCDHDNTLSMTWNWTTSPDATCLIDRLELRYTCYLLNNMENSDRQERSNGYSRSGNKGTGSLVVEQEWIMNTTYTVQCEVGGSYEISADGPCRLLLPNKKLNATCSIPSVESSAVILPSTTAIQPTATRSDLSMALATTRQLKFTPVASMSSAMEEDLSMALATTRQPKFTPVASMSSAMEEGTQELMLIVALVASSTVVVVVVLSTAVVIFLLPRIRRKQYDTSMFEDLDVFKPDFFPVKPDKKVIFIDNISLKSKLSPLEAPHKTKPVTTTEIDIVMSEVEDDEEESDEILQEDLPKKALSATVSLDSEERYVDSSGYITEVEAFLQSAKMHQTVTFAHVNK